jgi:hypothetical protein
MECANRTEVRALQTAEPQTPTPSSYSETIVGETTLQGPKNDHHGEDTGKQRQEIQSRRKIENKLSITIPSLSPHIPNQEFSSTRPFSEAPNFPSRPETTIYVRSPFMNPWDRPASASSNLPHTHTIRAMPCISLRCGDRSMAEQAGPRHSEGYSVWGLNPACCYHPRQDWHRSCCCLHYADDCCHCPSNPVTRDIPN